jgi:hypothetical protein
LFTTWQSVGFTRLARIRELRLSGGGDCCHLRGETPRNSHAAGPQQVGRTRSFETRRGALLELPRVSALGRATSQTCTHNHRPRSRRGLLVATNSACKRSQSLSSLQSSSECSAFGESGIVPASLQNNGRVQKPSAPREQTAGFPRTAL